MRVTILILLLSLLRGMLPAQQIYFSNNYEVFPCSNTLGSVVQKADSGYVFVTNNFISPYGYSFISTDKYGDTLFNKSYILPLTSCGVASGPHALVTVQDGNYVACGSAMDTSNNRNGYVVKFSQTGDTLWTKTIAGSAYDALNSMYEDDSGDLWLCGSTWSEGNGQGDCWLMHMDSNGNIITDTTYGTAQNETALCGELTPDGGFILSGYSGTCPYVAKIDNAGGCEWQYSYCNYNGFAFVSLLNDSEYVVACCDILSASETQACLLKLDAEGNEIWNRTFGFASNEEVLFGKPIILPDGIVLSGTSTPLSDYPGAYLAKTDLNGYMVWQRRYTINPNSYQEIYDVKPTSDDGFILSGYCLMSTQDAWLLKVDSMGCEVAGCDAVGMTEPENENAIAVFPNPASDMITFQFPEAQSRTLIIYDTFGKEVHRAQTNQTLFSISVEEYAEGMYFYSVLEENETAVRGTFVVQ